MTESEWNYYTAKPITIKAKRMLEPFECKTMEGTMRGNPGDWLIIGTEEEQYPCKDIVFKKKYSWVKEIDRIRTRKKRF